MADKLKVTLVKSPIGCVPKQKNRGSTGSEKS